MQLSQEFLFIFQEFHYGSLSTDIYGIISSVNGDISSVNDREFSCNIPELFLIFFKRLWCGFLHHWLISRVYDYSSSHVNCVKTFCLSNKNNNADWIVMAIMMAIMMGVTYMYFLQFFVLWRMFLLLKYLCYHWYKFGVLSGWLYGLLWHSRIRWVWRVITNK